MSFGVTLRRLREEKKLSQTELGKYVDLKQQEISYLENDTREPKIETLKKLSSFFNVSIDYLCGISNTKYINEGEHNTTFSELYSNLNSYEKKIILEIMKVLIDNR